MHLNYVGGSIWILCGLRWCLINRIGQIRRCRWLVIIPILSPSIIVPVHLSITRWSSVRHCNVLLSRLTWSHLGTLIHWRIPRVAELRSRCRIGIRHDRRWLILGFCICLWLLKDPWRAIAVRFVSLLLLSTSCLQNSSLSWIKVVWARVVVDDVGASLWESVGHLRHLRSWHQWNRLRVRWLLIVDTVKTRV